MWIRSGFGVGERSPLRRRLRGDVDRDRRFSLLFSPLRPWASRSVLEVSPSALPPVLAASPSSTLPSVLLPGALLSKAEVL